MTVQSQKNVKTPLQGLNVGMASFFAWLDVVIYTFSPLKNETPQTDFTSWQPNSQLPVLHVVRSTSTNGNSDEIPVHIYVTFLFADATAEQEQPLKGSGAPFRRQNLLLQRSLNPECGCGRTSDISFPFQDVPEHMPWSASPLYKDWSSQCALR